MERLSESDVQKIIDWTWRKTPAHKIADRLCISSRTVHRWRVRYGFQCRGDGSSVHVDAGPCAKCGTPTRVEDLTAVRKVCYTCAYGRPRTTIDRRSHPNLQEGTL